MATTSSFGKAVSSLTSVSLSTSSHLFPYHTFSLLPTSSNVSLKISTKSISSFNITHVPKTRGRVGFRAMASSSDSQLEETVKRTISDNPVVVYSKTWCSYSSGVKQLFKGIGVQPHVIELDRLGSEGGQLQQVLENMTGQRTVPNVFIGAKHIGGFTDTVKLHEEGDLESLLSEAGVKREI